MYIQFLNQIQMRYSKKRTSLAGILICIVFLCTIQLSAADNTDVGTEISSSYKLQPENGIIQVSKEITFTNSDSDTTYWRGYYSNFNYYLPEGAANIEVHDSENPMKFYASEEGYYVFDFNRKIWYGDSYTFFINYEMEMNKNTAVFSMSEYGDNIEVTLEVPSDFDTRLSRDDYEVEEKMYSSIYRFEKGTRWDKECIVNSVRASKRLSLKNTAHLSQRDVGIEVRYWEGEDAWAQDIMDTTIESLEILESKWGIPYPPKYNITIIQANITETGGYGGYNEGRNGIWLLYTSNHGILIHELSHYWTRACNFDQLWMDEGYADLYTYIVLSDTDPEEAASRKNRFLGRYEKLENKYDYPLSDWDVPDSLDESQEDQIDFGYKKAFSLMYTVYEDAGIEALQEMNYKFISSEDGIDNSDYLEILDSCSEIDTDIIRDYIYT